MTEPAFTTLAPAPLTVLELWGDPQPAGARIAHALGHRLPAAGRADGALLRLGPATWLVEGDCTALADALGDDGALTAVGGGMVRVRISGAGWRAALMEGGLFDAENPSFAPGCVATTVIEHVTLTLRVESAQACLAYVPASQAQDLLDFWGLVQP